jgi:hypothetical protein
MKIFKRTILLYSVYSGFLFMAIIGILNFNKKLPWQMVLPAVYIISMYAWYRYDRITIISDGISFKGMKIINSELDSVVVKENFVYFYKLGLADPIIITCEHYDNSDELIDRIKYIFINKVK